MSESPFLLHREGYHRAPSPICHRGVSPLSWVHPCHRRQQPDLRSSSSPQAKPAASTTARCWPERFSPTLLRKVKGRSSSGWAVRRWLPPESTSSSEQKTWPSWDSLRSYSI